MVCLFSWRYNPLWLYFHSPVAGFSLIFEVSLSHTTTRHSRQDSSGRVINPSQRPLTDKTQHSQQTNIHTPGGIRTQNLSRREAADLRLRPRGHWDRLLILVLGVKKRTQKQRVHCRRANRSRKWCVRTEQVPSRPTTKAANARAIHCSDIKPMTVRKNVAHVLDTVPVGQIYLRFLTVLHHSTNTPHFFTYQQTHQRPHFHACLFHPRTGIKIYGTCEHTDRSNAVWVTKTSQTHLSCTQFLHISTTLKSPSQVEQVPFPTSMFVAL